MPSYARQDTKTGGHCVDGRWYVPSETGAVKTQTGKEEMFEEAALSGPASSFKVTLSCIPSRNAEPSLETQEVSSSDIISSPDEKILHHGEH